MADHENHKDFQLLWHSIKIQHAERQRNIYNWRKQGFAETYEREPAWEGGSNLQIPVTQWATEVIHDRLFLSQFGVNAPLIQIKPLDLNDTQIANNLEKVLKHYQRVGKKANAVSLALFDAILLGCGVVRIDWRKEKRKWGRTRMYRYPKTEWVPLENFFLGNPFSEEQNVVCHLYYRRKAELKALADKGLVDGDVIETLTPAIDLPFFTSEDDETLSPIVASKTIDDTVPLVDIFYRDTEDNWRIATYAPNDNIVLSDVSYDYPTDRLPFFMLRFIPKAYGRGLATILQPLEDELSVLHNQRIDNNTLVNLPVFKVLTSSPALKDKEVWFAGKKIPVDTPEDITPIQISERITPLHDEMQLFDYIKLFTGISELLSGNPLRGEKTAYEIEATLAEGSVRFRRYIHYVVEWVKEQAQFELLLLKHYGDDAEIYNITKSANPFDMISDEDILYRFNIEANSILTNKELERQRWFLIRNLLSQEPSVVNNPSAWYEVLRQLLTAYDVDYKTILGEKPEPQPPAPMPAMGMAGMPPELMQTLMGALSGGGEANPNSGLSPQMLQALQEIANQQSRGGM